MCDALLDKIQKVFDIARHRFSSPASPAQFFSRSSIGQSEAERTWRHILAECSYAELKSVLVSTPGKRGAVSSVQNIPEPLAGVP